MPVDVSFYGQRPPDPVAGISSAVGLANGIVQNRIAQQELASRQAIGNAFQNAVGPNGQFDPNAALTGVAGDPAGAYGAPEAVQRALTARTTNLANQGAEVGQSQTRMNDFYQSLGPLLADKNKPPTRAQVMGTAADLLHQGRLLPADYTAITAEVPLDNGAVAGYAQNKFGSTLPPGQQMAPGPPITTSSGTRTPTLPQFFREATTGSGPTAAAPNGTPVQTDRNGNSLLPNGHRVPNAAPPPNGVQTGPAMGTSENITTNLNAYNVDQNTGAAKLANARNLTTVIPLMEQMDDSDAGPGSRARNQVMAWLQTQGIATTRANVRQEAAKYLNKYTSTNPVAARSDEAQNLAAASSPNLEISLPAALHLAKSAVGFDRMDAAVPAAYDLAHPGQPQAGPDYLKFKTNYYATQPDPRAFNFDLLQPAEQRSLVQSLGPKDGPAYQNFRSSLQMAHDTKMLEAPASAPAVAPNGGQ